MKLYKTKKNCGKLLLGILAFCTGMILLTGCGSSSEQKQNKNEETAEENKEEFIILTIHSTCPFLLNCMYQNILYLLYPLLFYIKLMTKI